MKTHFMNLDNKYFEKIRQGQKTVELRLFDEKRQELKTGDEIIFNNRLTSENIKVEITAIKKYVSFEELYKHYNNIEMGYNENEKANPEDMAKYYTKEDQEKFGVCGIEIKLKEE